MLIIRKNQTNNLIATVSMNKTLANPYYLFSFQHIASKERISFIPQVITSNIRYDKFRFVEAQTTNLSLTPPNVFFEYLGQYYYSIYEQVSSGNTDPSLAYNKLESGRAWVIVGNDDMDECFFEPYISNDEDFAQVIYVSEEEENCIYPNITPSITPSNSPTPSITPSTTPTNTPTPSITPTFTPTPSSTPAPNLNPSGYSAMWWSQFSNPSYLDLTGGGLIKHVIDGVDGSTLMRGGDPAISPTDKPKFVANVFASTTPNFSGSALFNVAGLTGERITSLNGDYPLLTAATDFTFFTRFYWTGSTNEMVLLGSDSGGGGLNSTLWNNTSVPYRWIQLKLLNNNIEFNRWFNPDTGNDFVGFNITASANTWIDLGWRTYQDGSFCKSEAWINGVIVSSGTTIATATPPSTAPGQIQGASFEGYIAEQFYFNRKLTNGEMSDMFTYLNNRY